MVGYGLMPTNGLSLVGFITDQQQALTHLRTGCVPGTKTDAQLIAEWHTAQANLGHPVPNAGKPSMRPIPASHHGYIQQLMQSPGVAQDPSLQGVTCEQVEIEPLLAYQVYVDTDRSTRQCTHLSRPPTIDELLNLCLPLAAPAEPLMGVGQPSSALLKSPSLNVRIKAGGILAPDVVGIRFRNCIAAGARHHL